MIDNKKQRELGERMQEYQDMGLFEGVEATSLVNIRMNLFSSNPHLVDLATIEALKVVARVEEQIFNYEIEPKQIELSKKKDE